MRRGVYVCVYVYKRSKVLFVSEYIKENYFKIVESKREKE